MKLETTEVKHTPTPWAFGASAIAEDKFVIGNSDWSKTIALLDSFHDAKEVKANAAFIVRAVNSHDELLQLAKAMKSYLMARPIQQKDADTRWMLRGIEAALKAAGEL